MIFSKADYIKKIFSGHCTVQVVESSQIPQQIVVEGLGPSIYILSNIRNTLPNQYWM